MSTRQIKSKYHFPLDTSEEIGRPTVRGHPFSRGGDFPRMSSGLFRVETRHGRIKNTQSDRIYLVVDGEGEFRVDDEAFTVRRGETVVVPRGTPYDYEGRMTLFLVHSPANEDEFDISLEEKPEIGEPPAPPKGLG